MKGTLLELLREKYFLLEPGFFTGARNRVLSDPTGVSFAPQTKEDAVQGVIRFRAGSVVDSFSSGKIWMGDADYINRYRDIDDDDCIVNVVRLTSAMTRGGGECSCPLYPITIVYLFINGYSSSLDNTYVIVLQL